MNIETQITPNPETLKFIVGKEYIFQDSIEITSEKEAEVFNFSKDFFQLNGVKSLFIGTDYISVTKKKILLGLNLKQKYLLLF